MRYSRIRVKSTAIFSDPESVCHGAGAIPRIGGSPDQNSVSVTPHICPIVSNDKMIPGSPLKVSDPVLQAKIDSLDLLSEALVAEVNLRARRLHSCEYA